MEVCWKLYFQTLKYYKYKTFTFRDHVDILCNIQFIPYIF